MRFTIDRLDHLVITCRDVDTSASWYQRVLGMERENYGETDHGEPARTALKFGGQKVNLRPEFAQGWVTGEASVPGAQDLCFVTAVGPEQVVTHLQGCGVVIEAGPVSRAGALGPIASVYCRDPDGNLIEIASYLAD